jgi:peptide chain release factor 3
LHGGVVQAFSLRNGAPDVPLLAAVGPLQFEVVQYRLESEYGAPARLKPAQWELVRWVKPPTTAAQLSGLLLADGVRVAQDRDGLAVILFPTKWHVGYFQKNHPQIELLTLPPKPTAVMNE